MEKLQPKNIVPPITEKGISALMRRSSAYLNEVLGKPIDDSETEKNRARGFLKGFDLYSRRRQIEYKHTKVPSLTEDEREWVQEIKFLLQRYYHLFRGPSNEKELLIYANRWGKTVTKEVRSIPYRENEVERIGGQMRELLKQGEQDHKRAQEYAELQGNTMTVASFRDLLRNLVRKAGIL